MEAEPYIPLPKENVNQPLVFNQLLMLWIIWVGGLTAGLFALFGEFFYCLNGQNPKNQKRHTRIGQDSLIHPMAPQPAVEIDKKYGKRSQLNFTVE